ncbi:hypothetical protein INR49_012966 [Caranx melampygus]|nr:hypothetical protein INR49_012966 [Caranx melampygus]
MKPERIQDLSTAVMKQGRISAQTNISASTASHRAAAAGHNRRLELSKVDAKGINRASEVQTKHIVPTRARCLLALW